LYFSNPTGWNVTKTAALEGVAEKMAGVRVTAEDYTAVLREPGENVVIYCDPPYLVNSGLSKTSQLYAHNFTLADHERFAAEVRACRHKVVVSYDDDEGGVIRSLFRGFNFHTAEWTYCGTSSAKAANGPQTKKVGKELIITNYGEIV
jgi:DNA adenine methylase